MGLEQQNLKLNEYFQNEKEFVTKKCRLSEKMQEQELELTELHTNHPWKKTIPGFSDIGIPIMIVCNYMLCIYRESKNSQNTGSTECNNNNVWSG